MEYKSQLINECKKYKLDDILYKIGYITKEMAESSSSIKYVDCHKQLGSYYQHGHLYITPWLLNRLVYYLICNSNDYKYKIARDQDLFSLVALYQSYDNEKSNIQMQNISSDDTLLYIVFGHSQEQFWYQNKEKILMQFNRNTEILLNAWQDINSSIDINIIIQKELRMDALSYNKALALLCLISMLHTEIDTKYEVTMADANLNENLQQLIQLYTVSYNSIRQDNILQEQLLFTKPIIKTDTGRLIITNTYLLLKLLSDGLYWVVRNYFYKKNSQAFINDFGKAFESYLSNILSYYLDKHMYYRLVDTNKHKIADWMIETERCVIILEQKSTLASLRIKNLYPNIQSIKQYLNKFNEAFDQLNVTEKNCVNNNNNKKVMKLVVLYEDMPVANILREQLLKQRGYKNEDTNIFFINIYELERLLYTLSLNTEIFHKIVFKMLNISSKLTANSREFDQLMNEFHIKKYDYLKKHNHFIRIITEITNQSYDDIENIFDDNTTR